MALAARSLAPLHQRYLDVRGRSRALAAPLSVEDQNLQSMPEASPVKWHLAHTTWFFETFVLEPFVRGYRVFHPAFRMLFNSYYNAVGAQFPRPQRALLSRPSLDEVHAWRAHVDAALLDALDAFSPAERARVELGLSHEEQHQELILTDVKHALAVNPLGPVYVRAGAFPSSAAPPMHWSVFEERVHALGHDGHGFAFDNEGPRHRVITGPFSIASRLVTNLEYLEFMEDGGYARPELWLSEGWDAVRLHGWDAPLYWQHVDGIWRHFTLHGWRDVRLDEPVTHVSYFEADAFARWAGARLPTEAEWERAALTVRVDGNLGSPHPRPAERGSLVQMFGDCWEWTQSAYAPYPGFRPSSGALGEYNGKFMCNQMVLRGGSCATPPGHIRATYRNFFAPHSRWQFSGIRLCLDGEQVR